VIQVHPSPSKATRVIQANAAKLGLGFKAAMVIEDRPVLLVRKATRVT
jgi:hypothetical protein